MEHPIICTGDEVNAIITGRQRQLQRAITDLGHVAIGDRLWVQETWDQHTVGGERCIVYRADSGDAGDGLPWRLPIHMPRAHSRLTLEVTDKQRVWRDGGYTWVLSFCFRPDTQGAA